MFLIFLIVLKYSGTQLLYLLYVCNNCMYLVLKKNEYGNHQDKVKKLFLTFTLYFAIVMFLYIIIVFKF